MECAWYISKPLIHVRSHNVKSLSVHLLDQNEINFELGKENEALISIATDTKLLAYFKLNRLDVQQIYYILKCYYITYGKIITKNGNAIRIFTE